MRQTGFLERRAVEHDVLLDQFVEKFAERGYMPTVLDVDGDRPDIQLSLPNGEKPYVDIKTGYRDDTGNVAIKLGCLNHARTSEHTTYFVFADAPDCPVHIYESLMRRFNGGPCPPSGNGSRTSFAVFNLRTSLTHLDESGYFVTDRTPTRFDQLFPDLYAGVAA